MRGASHLPSPRLRHGRHRSGYKNERVTRLELATSSLARRCSTTELHPHFEREGIMASHLPDARFLSGRNDSKMRLFLNPNGGLPASHSQRTTMKTAILTCLCSIVLALPAFGQSPTPA